MSIFAARVPRYGEKAEDYCYQQMREVEKSWTEPTDFLSLSEIKSAPKKVSEGLIVLADGVNWNPTGAGRGVYCYYGGAWNKLG